MQKRNFCHLIKDNDRAHGMRKAQLHRMLATL